MMDLGNKLILTLRMIKIEHSVFALPFALISMLVAAHGLPTGRILLWILVAMIAARSCAMAFNRLADVSFDRLNPRTKNWPLPSGLLSRGFVLAFVLVSAAILVLAASQLNRLTLLLSPVALAIISLYSLTKRFTFFSHWFLGLALAIAPAGAWIAVRGTLNTPPLFLCAAILFWTAGFDLIYSCQDSEFDREHHLYSVPSRFGIPAALWISGLCHALTVALLLWFGHEAALGIWYFAGCALVAALLTYEHTLVKPRDLSRVNEAFFTVNGLISVLLLLATSLDLYF
jgi:4-hydroxybenzoate polyprenyltransferase